MVKGGYTNYGQMIGILMLDTIFPRLEGDIGNAFSYDFPVRYKIVKGAETERIMGDKPDPDLIKPFIEAAMELEDEGVKAITTSCGFLAPFQKLIATQINIPVFTSALILVPLVRTMLNPKKKIAVFTERAWHLNETHFNGVGWSQKDIPVIIKGMKEDAVFPSVFIGNQMNLDYDVLQKEMEDMTRELMEANPDTGAIVLECTNMGPFTKQIHAVSGVPVFGINHLVEFIYSTINQRYYIRDIY